MVKKEGRIPSAKTAIAQEIRQGHEQSLCLLAGELVDLLWTADERFRTTHQVPHAVDGTELSYTIFNNSNIFLHHQPVIWGKPELQLSYKRRVHGFGIGGSGFVTWQDQPESKLNIDLHIDEKTRKTVEKRGHRLFSLTWYMFNSDATITKRIENPYVRGEKRTIHKGRWGTFIETPVESEAEYELIGGILTQMTLSVKKAMVQTPEEASEF